MDIDITYEGIILNKCRQKDGKIDECSRYVVALSLAQKQRTDLKNLTQYHSFKFREQDYFRNKVIRTIASPFHEFVSLGELLLVSHVGFVSIYHLPKKRWVCHAKIPDFDQ